MREQLKWYDEKADNSPWIRALAELRQRAAREGHCYQHVQAITVAIDQNAEKALGNRHYFLNKPYGVGLTTRRLASYAKRRVRRAAARLPMSSAASRMTVRQRTSTSPVVILRALPTSADDVRRLATQGLGTGPSG
jgi:predicted ABC-class ATPase